MRFLAFTDDDVTVGQTWLQNLTAPLDSGEWAGVGGRILPEQGFLPPRWLLLDGPYNMGGTLAIFDCGLEAGELTQAVGANMAFRKALFEKYGAFRPDIGPRPGSEVRGEDWEFRKPADERGRTTPL